MIDPTNPALDKTPETFDGIRVNLADDIDALAMVDSLMLVSPSIKPVVGAKGISEDGGFREYMFLDESAQCVRFHVGRNEGANLPLALNHTDNRSFLGSASARSLGPAPVVRLIHFDFATESANRPALFIGQHRANLFEHAPRRLVGHSRFPLNLLGRDSASGLRHQIDRIEPSGERSGRLVKDRLSGRVNMMAAMIARVRRTALDAVMLSNRVARLAKDAVWVQVVAQPFQTRRIIWELFLEVFQRVRQHVRFAVVVSHWLPTLTPQPYQIDVPTVKG